MTGSTKGIGRAMVQGLAEAGASVVVSSRKQDLCDEVAAEVAASTGQEAFGRACHVGDWDAIPGFVDAVVERFGRIDVLVNNAGISPSRAGVGEMTLDLWRKIFAVNLEGPLRMSQCVAPVMRDGGGGSIVNIGSMAGYHAGSAVSRLRRVEGRAAEHQPHHGPGVGRVGGAGERPVARARSPATWSRAPSATPRASRT